MFKRPDVRFGSVDNIQKQLEITAARYREINKLSTDSSRIISDQFSIFKEENRKWAVQIAKQKEESRKWAEKIGKAFKELPEKTQSSLINLAKRGWYLDFHTTPFETYSLSQKIENGELDEVDKILVDHYQERKEDIVSELIQKYPSRKIIIEAAIKAHKRKEYELSIPVLLSQADGIYHDIVGINIFSGIGRELLKKSTENKELSYSISLMYLLTIDEVPLFKSEKNRPENFIGLNRHLVLHGVDVSYASEMNSCKSLSFINYISGLESTLSRISADA